MKWLTVLMPYYLDLAQLAILAISVLIATISVVLSLYIARQSQRTQRELQHGENLLAALDDPYLGRNTPKKHLGRYGAGTDLAATRSAIWRELNEGGQLGRNLDEFRAATLCAGTAEAVAAEHLLLELQRLGLRVFGGAYPAAVILAGVGVQVVHDWMLCEAVYNIHYRDSPSFVFGARDSSVPFSRRHAEAIACLAYLYVDKYWAGSRVDAMLALTELDPASAADRLSRITAIDAITVRSVRTVMRDINSVTSTRRLLKR
jgi:hypothetical protein